MGVTAENLAEQYNITRDDSDKFALSSQQKWKTGEKSSCLARLAGNEKLCACAREKVCEVVGEGVFMFRFLLLSHALRLFCSSRCRRL